MRGDVVELVGGVLLFFAVVAAVFLLPQSCADTNKKIWLRKCAQHRPLVECEADYKKLD